MSIEEITSIRHYSNCQVKWKNSTVRQ